MRPEVELEEKRREVEGEPAAAPISAFTIDSYPTGKQAFEEIQSDELMVERLMRVVRNEGYEACDEIVVMRAVRQFFTIEEAKPNFTNRPRDELKNHLVNWIRKTAKTLNQYA